MSQKRSLGSNEAEFYTNSGALEAKLDNLTHLICACVWYPASRGFFLASLLPCTKLFASLVFHVVGSQGKILETQMTSNTLKDFLERNLCQQGIKAQCHKNKYMVLQFNYVGRAANMHNPLF